MKLDTGAIFWAVSIVSAASYIVCAAFVHVDLSSLARHITWPSFFGGMLCFSLVMGILAGASASAYNRLMGKLQ